jgi:hypothetical protein
VNVLPSSALGLGGHRYLLVAHKMIGDAVSRSAHDPHSYRLALSHRIVVSNQSVPIVCLFIASLSPPMVYPVSPLPLICGYAPLGPVGGGA